ncbi:MAG: methylated-DNA--[protein]-cysteine S-methyltransferase [Sedimenticola sp.]
MQGQTMPSDYQRIERAIHWIANNTGAQPELGDLARFLGLSPYHTQRLFSRWAGVSPKQFLQYLTVNHAKQLLDESHSVLSASLEAGLSSPARLHDQMISIEAVTPGEYKRGGEGLKIAYGFHDTPFGGCLLATTPRGICHLAFTGSLDRHEAVQQLAARWPNAQLCEAPSETDPLVKKAFDLGENRGRELKLLVKGTNFQVKVWKALLAIPPGCAQSYREVAQRIGSPRAARAVGTANTNNAIAYLIPCHRVIRGSGIIGEYRWGSDRKRAMLAWEAGHSWPLHHN